QISDQVVGVFNADRVSNQRLGYATRSPFLARGFHMARGRGRASNRFDRPKICGEMRIAQTRKEFLHGRETAIQNKAEDATVSAHLTASDRVILMRFQAGIKRGRDLRM